MGAACARWREGSSASGARAAHWRHSAVSRGAADGGLAATAPKKARRQRRKQLLRWRAALSRTKAKAVAQLMAAAKQSRARYLLSDIQQFRFLDSCSTRHNIAI
jgi:hypothetical protein